MVIPLVFVVVAPGRPEPIGVFHTPHNAAGFLRDLPDVAGASVLEYWMETPTTVREPVRWRYVGGELVGPAGEVRRDMFEHLQVEPPAGAELHQFDRITRDSAVMGGKPCIRGMRVTVGMIVGQIAAGHTVETLHAEFPYLQRADITQALRYAAWLAQGGS